MNLPTTVAGTTSFAGLLAAGVLACSQTAFAQSQYGHRTPGPQRHHAHPHGEVRDGASRQINPHLGERWPNGELRDGASMTINPQPDPRLQRVPERGHDVQRYDPHTGRRGGDDRLPDPRLLRIPENDRNVQRREDSRPGQPQQGFNRNEGIRSPSYGSRNNQAPRGYGR